MLRNWALHAVSLLVRLWTEPEGLMFQITSICLRSAVVGCPVTLPVEFQFHGSCSFTSMDCLRAAVTDVTAYGMYWAWMAHVSRLL